MSIYGKSRMINIDLLKTNTFLDLPTESKLLYIFIICEADDDGVVNVEPLLRYLNLNVDALNILQIKGFILPLGNAQFRVADSIFFIKDFHLHNTIPSNKKKDSLYKPVIQSLYPEEAKYLTEPAHKERKINTNYFEVNEEELEVIEDKKEEYDDYVDTNENIQNVNFEINNSCAKLNQTKLNQTKLNHHLLQEETIEKKDDIENFVSIDNEINDEEEDIKLEVGELFYGKYQNILLTDNDVNIINTWKYPTKLIDITSEFIKNSTSSFKSQFPIIEQKAKEYGWYNSEIHYFGRKRNLILTEDDYSFFDEKYVDIDKHLKRIADRTQKTKINKPLAYIETIAQKENWLEKEEEELAKYKAQQNKLKQEAEEKALKEKEKEEYKQKIIEKFNLPSEATEEMITNAMEIEKQKIIQSMQDYLKK